MTTTCEQLALLLKMERDIIEKHIAEHKWFRHIPDHNQGVADFIQNYGWLMREIYCSKICAEREHCGRAHQEERSSAATAVA